MSNYKLLILSYSFSNTEIASKRWTNLAHELAENNLVDVITSTRNINTFNKINKFFFVKSRYPEILDKRPKNLIEKIQYKYALIKQVLFYKGSYYDKGKNNYSKLRTLVLDLQLQNNYDVIITTGAPFSWLKIVPDLIFNKLISDDVLIFSDLRDPWSWGIGYGMNSINKKRKKFEMDTESFVVNSSDKVFVPSELMKSNIEKNYNIKCCSLLPHGFDKQKINNSIGKLKGFIKNNELIKIIYGGTWYQDIDSVFLTLLRHFSFYNISFEFNIYSNSNFNKVLECKDSYSNIKVNINSYIAENLLFENIYKSNFYILILPKTYSNFLSAKFFEICYIGTPIIFIGKQGLVSEFITENNFGIHIEEDDLNNKENIISKLDFIGNQNRDVLNNYTFKNLSQMILHDINYSSKLQ